MSFSPPTGHYQVPLQKSQPMTFQLPGNKVKAALVIPDSMASATQDARIACQITDYTYTFRTGKIIQSSLLLHLGMLYGKLDVIPSRAAAANDYDLYIEPTPPVISLVPKCREVEASLRSYTTYDNAQVDFKIRGSIKIVGRDGQILAEARYDKSHEGSHMQGIRQAVSSYNAMIEKEERYPEGSKVEMGPLMLMFNQMAATSLVMTDVVEQLKESEKLSAYVQGLSDAPVRTADRPREQRPAGKGAVAVDNAPPVITVTSPSVKRGLKVAAKEQALVVSGTAEDASGVASVTVNGQQASLDEKGNFSAEVLLKVGENQITIEAVDVYRNAASHSFAVVRAPGTAPVTAKPAKLAQNTPQARGRDYALVIGINGYKYLDKLKTAVNDANAVAKVLSEEYGFETRHLLDGKATRDAILKELNVLRKKLTSEDRLLVYYAGHGEYDKETDTAYWLPIDAEKDETTKWIEAKSITDELKRIASRQVLVVADSCYSGTLTRKAATELTANDTRESYLQKLMAKPARVLIASGGNEPVADAGGNRHSIFADAFIKALQSPGHDVFTAEELLTNQLKESVAGRAEQTPEYKVIRNSGHDGGDFVFVKRK